MKWGQMSISWGHMWLGPAAHVQKTDEYQHKMISKPVTAQEL